MAQKLILRFDTLLGILIKGFSVSILEVVRIGRSLHTVVAIINVVTIVIIIKLVPPSPSPPSEAPAPASVAPASLHAASSAAALNTTSATTLHSAATQTHLTHPIV